MDRFWVIALVGIVICGTIALYNEIGDKALCEQAGGVWTGHCQHGTTR